MSRVATVRTKIRVEPVLTRAAQRAGEEMLKATGEAVTGLLARLARGVHRSITAKEPVRETREVEMASYIESHPKLACLEQAVRGAAQELGGQVCQSYRDCNDREHECLWAIRTSRFPKGVGIRIDEKGNVLFAYDRHAGDPAAANEIQVAVTTHFNVKAAAVFLRERGYQVKLEQRQEAGSPVVVSVVGAK